MANKQSVGYEVDGQIAHSLGELSDILGVEKVAAKDLKEGGKYFGVVSLVDLAQENTSNEGKTEDEPVVEDTDKEEIYTALSPEDIANLENIDAEEIKASFPEFEDVEELKEFIKDIDTATLEYLATGLGLEWSPTYHANIHRMRIAMELKKYFFPEMFKPKEPKKKKAKYGDFSTEKLFAMAEESGLEVNRSGNDPIDRMRVIMALKKEGILAE